MGSSTTMASPAAMFLLVTTCLPTLSLNTTSRQSARGGKFEFGSQIWNGHSREEGKSVVLKLTPGSLLTFSVSGF